MLSQVDQQHVTNRGGGLPQLLAGDDALIFQARVAVVVDAEGQLLGVGEGLALEGHIFNALTGGLGQINLVVEADEMVMEIAGLVRVEGDVHIAGLPLIPAGSGPLHIGFHFRAGDLDRIKHVGVFINVKQVAVVEVALLQIAGVLEQGHSGDIGAGVFQLDGTDEIDDSGILKAAFGQTVDLIDRLEVGGGMTQHIVLDKGNGLGLGGLNGGNVPQTLIRLHILHGHGFHSGSGDLLAAIEGQIIADHFARIVLGLANRDGAVIVDVGGVGVAQLQYIHFGTLIQNGLGGIGAVGGVFSVQTRMGRNHNDIGAGADFVDALGHGVGHGRKGQIGHALLGAVPTGNVGRRHANDGHLDAAALHDGVTGAGEIGAVGVLDVGGQNRHLSLGQNGLEIVHAKVEFMVAQNPGVVLHVVEGRGYRVICRVLGIEIVGHNGALDGIAGVHQNGVGVFRPNLLDVGGNPGQTVSGALLHIFVGVAPDIAVGVRSADDGQMDLAGFRRQGGGGEGQHQGCAQYRRQNPVSSLFAHFLVSFPLPQNRSRPQFRLLPIIT